jgi:hypothetical protein
VYGRKAAGGKRSCDYVVLSPPPGAFQRNSGTRQAVDGREREDLGLAVVPSEAHEQAEAVRNRLVETNACAVP